MMDQAEKLRKIVSEQLEQDTRQTRNSRVITITSGKGGVGKTNFLQI